MANTGTKKQSTSKKVDMSDVLTDNSTELNLEKATPGTVTIDDSALINVKSNVFGELFFIDPVTKEEISWPQCGATQQLPMATLRHMKTGCIKFFVNQLVVITGFADENADKYEVADIYKALYITQYYKDFLDPSDYEKVCSWSIDEIKERVPRFSSATKMKLVVALNIYIEKGVLDSLKAIKAFEEVLGCELKMPE